MYHLRDKFDFGVAMSPTRDTLETWRGKIPRASIYTNYTQTVVEAMLAVQERTEDDPRPMKNLFLFLDDCMFEKKLLASDCMRELFMNGRHKKIFFMNTVQYMMDISPQIRGCIDYVFVMRDPILSNRKRLYEYFFGIFPTQSDFNRTMTTCTSDYACMVFCKRARSECGIAERVEDSVFWYCANPVTPAYRLCKPVYWYLDDYYNVSDSTARQDNGKGKSTNQAGIQNGVMLAGR
jgi:hypothetical protein